MQTAGTPCSYIVETPSGKLRRNRAHLRIRTDPQLPVDMPVTETALLQPVTLQSGPVTRSQTGTVLHPRIVYDIELRPERGRCSIWT